eukprot:3809059-Prymnesium_polylepis.2
MVVLVEARPSEISERRVDVALGEPEPDHVLARGRGERGGCGLCVRAASARVMAGAGGRSQGPVSGGREVHDRALAWLWLPCPAIQRSHLPRTRRRAARGSVGLSSQSQEALSSPDRAGGQQAHPAGMEQVHSRRRHTGIGSSTTCLLPRGRREVAGRFPLRRASSPEIRLAPLRIEPWSISGSRCLLAAACAVRGEVPVACSTRPICSAPGWRVVGQALRVREQCHRCAHMRPPLSFHSRGQPASGPAHT